MRDIVKKVVKELADFPFVKAIYIFGSSALRETPISDVDICVLDDENFPRGERRKIYLYSEPPLDISLFSDLPCQIRYEVFRGKALLVKDKEFLVRAKEATLAQYFDMKPIWEEGLAIRKSCGHVVLA
jgi:predicted nucleotidyltransferase